MEFTIWLQLLRVLNTVEVSVNVILETLLGSLFYSYFILNIHATNIRHIAEIYNQTWYSTFFPASFEKRVGAG
jgi:hypothetical protein